jgi:hypothetical protein
MVALVEERVIALEVKIDHLVKQVDHLVFNKETNDIILNNLVAKLAVLEDRQANTTKVTIAIAAGLPIALMVIASLLGIKI